jgi:acyl-CoA reductase-like NAD-dependent aldehyde dehydrogenase
VGAANIFRPHRRGQPILPHGGQKLSGYGKDMSMYGLEDYTVVRHVMVKHG